MADDNRGKHEDVLHVEQAQDDVDAAKDAAALKPTEEFQGDVGLAGPGGIVYLIPTPSPDPRGTQARTVWSSVELICSPVIARPSQSSSAPEIRKYTPSPGNEICRVMNG